MQIHSAEAIVLRCLDYGEADRIVTFLTPEQGVFKGFARNARKSRKRFGGSLQTGAQVRLFWKLPRSGSLASLQEAELIDLRAGLRGDLAAMALCGYACELVENLLLEGQTHGEVYDLLRHLLDHLSVRGGSREARMLFELRLLSLCGYIPHLLHCSECDGGLGSELAGFSASRGGSLCPLCGPKGGALTVFAPVLATLAKCLRTPPELYEGFRFSDRTLQEGEGVLADALQLHLCRPLKSLVFLEQMLAGGGGS